MSEPTTFEIVIRGRASARLLRPLLDDFTFDHPSDGNTRLVGVVRDQHTSTVWCRTSRR